MQSAIGYVRVSTDKQDNSADAQERKIRAQAMLKEYDLVDVVVDLDQFSGDLDRPGVQRVLDTVKAKKVDAVIITKLDRLTRSTRDAIDLIELFAKKNVALVSIAESLDTVSPIGRFIVRLTASLGELDREMIGSRTRDGLQNLKAQGFPAGPAPYGFSAQPRSAEDKQNRIRKPIIPNPAEQAVIARIVELRAKDTGLKIIASDLNDAGHRTRSGGEFVFQDVARILKGKDKL